MDKIIGRAFEKNELTKALESNKSELVAVIGVVELAKRF
jgi:hypothetical protein